MTKVFFNVLSSKFSFKFKNHTVDLDVSFSLKECHIYIHYRDISDKEKNPFLSKEISDLVLKNFPYVQFIYQIIDSLEK